MSVSSWGDSRAHQQSARVVFASQRLIPRSQAFFPCDLRFPNKKPAQRPVFCCRVPLARLGRLQADGGNAGAGNLRIFGGFHTADADRTDALAVFQDRHAAFEHALNVGR